jgi:hypothetical protein
MLTPTKHSKSRETTKNREISIFEHSRFLVVSRDFDRKLKLLEFTFLLEYTAALGTRFVHDRISQVGWGIELYACNNQQETRNNQSSKKCSLQDVRTRCDKRHAM